MNMQKTVPEIDIVIPVYRPDERLHRLLLLLQQQTVKPSRILLVNTVKRCMTRHWQTGSEAWK